MYMTLIQNLNKKSKKIITLNKMSRSSSMFNISNLDDNTKIIIAFLAVAGLGLVVYSLSSCEGQKCKNTCGCQMQESYVQDFSGNSPGCTNSYRVYANSPNDTYTYPRNRCQMCKGYNNSSYEPFEYSQKTDFKLCPHNCRQYGVAACDQGTIM